MKKYSNYPVKGTGKDGRVTDDAKCYTIYGNSYRRKPRI
jgi:hypothetical protein